MLNARYFHHLSGFVINQNERGTNINECIYITRTNNDILYHLKQESQYYYNSASIFIDLKIRSIDSNVFQHSSYFPSDCVGNKGH